MYACLHIPAPAGDEEALFQLALQFSPAVERTAAGTVVFSITPLRRLMGPPQQVAAEICRLGNERNLQARLAIAAQPDTAILLARHYPGVTFAMGGEERFQLAPIPLTIFWGLVQNGMPEGARLDPELPSVFHRFAEAFRGWGLKTCGDLVAMPEKGIAERLGEAGVYLRNLAAGRIHRPLRVDPEETCYERQFELEYPLSLLEPLLFLFHRTLEDLCKLLRSQSRAARLLELKLTVVAPAVLPPVAAGEEPVAASKEVVGYVLTFPVPIDDSAAMLKLVQLHLERHPLPGAVGAFSLRVEPAEPKRLQGGLFLPATPAPDKLHVTLKRIEGMVGEGNIGMPRLLDTHRPDAFELAIRAGSKPENKSSKRGLPADSQAPGGEPQTVLRLALRVFRPALHARVRLAGIAPRQVIAPGVKGTVLEAAGPWKISGEWWTVAPWVREEWDVELDDGAIYRIYYELNMREWYVHSVYD
jgi:protein ImuB